MDYAWWYRKECRGRAARRAASEEAALDEEIRTQAFADKRETQRINAPYEDINAIDQIPADHLKALDTPEAERAIDYYNANGITPNRIHEITYKAVLQTRDSMTTDRHRSQDYIIWVICLAILDVVSSIGSGMLDGLITALMPTTADEWSRIQAGFGISRVLDTLLLILMSEQTSCPYRDAAVAHFLRWHGDFRRRTYPNERMRLDLVAYQWPCLSKTRIIDWSAWTEGFAKEAHFMRHTTDADGEVK